MLFFYAKSAQDRKIDTWVWFPCVYGFASSLLIAGSTISGLYKRMFSFVRNRETLFQSDCIILHSHQQWMRFLYSPYFIRIWCFHICFLAVQIGMLQYSSVLLICTLLMTVWCGASFHVLFCHPYVFFHKVSVKVIGPFFNQVFSYCWTLRNLYILDNSALSVMYFVGFFS